jgi:hypothetical protein
MNESKDNLGEGGLHLRGDQDKCLAMKVSKQ